MIPCLRLDASYEDACDTSRPLIPDPYCLMTGGYRPLRERMQQDPLYLHGLNAYQLRSGEAPQLEARRSIQTPWS